MGRPSPIFGRCRALPMPLRLLVATSRRGRRLASLGSQRLHAESAIHGDSRRGHEIRGSMGDQMGSGDSAACRQQRRRRMLEATARRGVKGRSQPRPISTEGSPQGLVEGPGVAWPSSLAGRGGMVIPEEERTHAKQHRFRTIARAPSSRRQALSNLCQLLTD